MEIIMNKDNLKDEDVTDFSLKVRGIIEKDGSFLVGRYDDVYLLPGGKVEQGEDEARAIEREIEEEFELKIKANKFLINNVCSYPNKIVDLRLYDCEYISGDFKLHDHSEYKWVSKDELLSYDLAPADIPLAEYVISL